MTDDQLKSAIGLVTTEQNKDQAFWNRRHHDPLVRMKWVAATEYLSYRKSGDGGEPFGRIVFPDGSSVGFGT